MKGLERGYKENNVLPRLFEVRGARILGGLQASHSRDYLSGLLIGGEIASMQRIFKFSKDDGEIVIIGSSPSVMSKGLSSRGLNQRALMVTRPSWAACFRLPNHCFKARSSYEDNRD